MRGLERAGLAAAAVATTAGIVTIGACSKTVSGTAEVNQGELSAYASEVTSSSAAASSSKAAAIERVTASACDAYSGAHRNSVQLFNVYIEALNQNRTGPDTETKAGAAVSALRDGARQIDGKLARDVLASVADPLRSYRDDSNNLADAVERQVAVDELNAIVDRFNKAKGDADAACKGHGGR